VLRVGKIFGRGYDSVSILITGGAGYIGSHTAKLLGESGLDVVILDNLSTGRRENLRWGAFIEGDIADVGLVVRSSDGTASPRSSILRPARRSVTR
jgi:nucleoside-diphosphate-sugar epimerase